MSYFYPQASVLLGIVFESFDGSQTKTSSLEANPFKVYTFTVIARRVSVHVNDYTQADTFTCEIDYKQFPFDPRAIRNCKVTIALDNMESLYHQDGTINQIIPSENNIVFQGFADEESIDFDDEKRTVKLEGRDFTGLFLDTKWTGESIETDEPLDELIAGLIEDVPALKNIKVINDTGLPLPTLAQFAPNYEIQEQKANAHPNASYWDVIQDLVIRAALICYVSIDKLIITKPRVLYNESKAKRMIYGVNLKNLEFKRKLGRKKGFNVSVRSFDFKKKESVLAEIPKMGKADWLKSIGLTGAEITIPQINTDGSEGTPKTAPYTSFRFANMTLDQAIEKGQDIFEQMGRQQLEGSLTSKDMQFPQVNGTCVRATDIDVGTPLKIEIHQDDLDKISRLGKISDRIQYLTDRCYPATIAKALARSLGKFSLTFYTKSLEFSMDQDTGFLMKVNFINFIQIENRSL
jgi:hypothetical protein